MRDKMELYNGRPEDTSGRKEKEIKVYDILDSLHIPSSDLIKILSTML